MAFDLTAKTQTPAEGMYAYMPNVPQVHNAIFTGDEGATIKAGAVVALDTTSTNTVAPVVKAAAKADKPYGVVGFNPINDVYNVGDKITLAEGGSSIFLVAAAAIAVGAELEFDPATRKVQTAATANAAKIGIAETAAAADGDFVQVKLDFNLGAVAGA